MRALITKDFWHQERTEVLEKGTEIEIERNEDDYEVVFEDGRVYIPNEYFTELSAA